MTNIICVEYEILISARVDLDSGVVQSVTAFPGDFNSVVPLQVYAGEHSGAEGLPEYLPAGHELAQQALEIADRIVVDGPGNIEVPFHLR